MIRHLLPRLGCLALAVSPTFAADLPIVRVTIGPDGAVVERSGVLPKGDEVVTGLPVGIDPARLAVAIDGLDTPPAIRLALPTPAALPPPDALWQKRLAEAQAAFDAVQPAIDLADLRARLARAVLALLPALVKGNPGDEQAGAPVADFTSGVRPATADQPVPTAAAQQSLLRFVTDNLTKAEADRFAARQARSAARAQLIALDEEREKARPVQVFTASLPLPGAGGRMVRLSYAVERAAWAPVYRIEVAGGRAMLVREALIDVPRDQGWTQGKLELVTRPPTNDLLLRDLLVPVLELGDEVVTERHSGKFRAIAHGGGSRASESAVDVAFRSANRTQHPDGTWGSDPWQPHATALNVLALLGAGYDHKSPNKYKPALLRAIGWLAQHDRANDLAAQALIAMALGEAFAMTNDAELKPSAERAIAILADRVANRHELDVAIYRRGPMAGPELLAWTAMAAKSAVAGGLSATSTNPIFATINRLLPELEGHADRDEAQVTRLVVDAFTGHMRQGYQYQPPVSEWLEHSSLWLQQGRPELVYFATLGLFQYGGDGWSLWNNTMRDKLVQLQNLGDRTGWSSATPYPLGEAAARAMITLPLEVYYRYKAIGKAEGEGKGLFGNRVPTVSVPELPPLPNAAMASQHWPVRIDAGAARLMDGQRMRVQLGRIELPGRIALKAVPADGAGAWRVLATANPLAVPLLSGDADVVVEGERLGLATLPFTEPGKELTLNLGRDDRVQVARSEERKDDEAWGKRTRTYTIHFRVDAPAGLYDAIRIDEAMPVPLDGSIMLAALDPAIAPEALDRRLVEDPVWHLDVNLKKPPAIAAITWQLRYPATVQPEVKKAQAPVSAGQAAFPNASGAEMELNAEDGQAEEEVKP
jgi:hypothetical protein